MREVLIEGIRIGGGNPLALISGPCVIEDEATTLGIAERLARIAEELGIPLIFKASYEKDNRSSVDGYRGPGLRAGLAILRRVKAELGIPLLSDVHRETDVEPAAEVLDVIQIPAFLCRQTSLLLKAGSTARAINVKKGQFLAPDKMGGSIGKILSAGNDRILLTERGSCFGYDRLVSDLCSIPVMQDLGFPVIYDATHILRGGGPWLDGGEATLARFAACLCRAAAAAGCDALFLEAHSDPRSALCDSSSSLALDSLPSILETAMRVSQAARGAP
jgi:2-dehydro-3-deoxyphosphooctonate aldolase (KDO 8-P synthase)